MGGRIPAVEDPQFSETLESCKKFYERISADDGEEVEKLQKVLPFLKQYKFSAVGIH